MVDYIFKHAPDYMDDRMTVEIFLSNEIHWTNYNLVPQPNKISSWYDESAESACVATSMSAVPSEYQSKLVQWTALTGGSISTYMLPILSEPIDEHSNTTKTFSLKNKPCFSGHSFQIAWDCENEQDQAISTYTKDSPLEDFQHTYDSYGKHVVKFSSNLLSVSFGDSTVGIQHLKSRSSNLVEFGCISQSRNLESICLSHLSATDPYVDHNIDPNCGGVWYDCYNLTSISLPDLKEFRAYAGMNCMYYLEKIDAQNVEVFNTGTGAHFKADVSLKEAVFPNLTAINSSGGYNFQTCISLSSVYMPKLVKASPMEFNGCINLKKTNFDSLSSVTNSMFAVCISLKSISLPSVKSIDSFAFEKCINLKSIDLSKVNAVPNLADVNAFDGLPDDYKVLVPHYLLQDFKAASNWSNEDVIDHITTK